MKTFILNTIPLSLVFLLTGFNLPAVSAPQFSKSCPKISNQESINSISNQNKRESDEGDRIKKSGLRIIARRLTPGQDLLKEIESIMKEKNIKAGVIISIVGSLKSAVIRMANQSSGKKLVGPFELVSSTGTIGAGSHHIHLSIADKDGTTIGGHAMKGCIVYTTVELVILDCSSQWNFKRTPCKKSGYRELNPLPIVK